MERKSSNNVQLSFWWKAKSSRYETCPRGFRLCCVLLRIRSAHRLEFIARLFQEKNESKGLAKLQTRKLCFGNIRSTHVSLLNWET